MALNHASIGSRIKWYRTLRKMTQEALAERIDVSPKFIGMVENAERGLSIDSFAAIVNALDVSADVLLFGNQFNTEAKETDDILYLLLDCDHRELEMLSRTIQFMKALLRDYRK